MTKEEFIKKWVVAYESKEQQIEFANEMKADLEGIITAENTRLSEELELERMRHAACGVIAMSNTHESLKKFSEMHPDYLSASVQACIDGVEREIRLREALERYEKVSEMIITTPSKSTANKEDLKQWQQTTIQMLESIK